MPQRETVPIPIDKGAWSGGDAVQVPPGFLRKLRNILIRAGVLVKRHQMTYDNVTGVRGLGTWHDTATGTRRLVSLDSSDVVRVKGSSGETWSSSVGSLQGDGVLLDDTSYRGRWYGVSGDTTRTPSGFGVYNGTAMASVSLNQNGGNIAPYTVTTHIDRVFFGGLKLLVYNFLYDAAGPTNRTYNASTWTGSAVTVENKTSSGATLCRVTPTNTTTSTLTGPDLTIAGGESYVWYAPFRGVSESYRVPITLKWKYTSAWAAGTDYEVGNVVIHSSAAGQKFVCTVAGTSGGAAPAWPTTGSTVADNTVTWLAAGSDVLAQQKIFVPTASESSEFTAFSCPVTVPPAPFSPTAGTIAPVIAFTHGTAITLAPVDFSYIDGKTDGDPRKQNYGHQITLGTFAFPFQNVDTPSSPTFAPTVSHSDRVYWSDVGKPEQLKATSNFKLTNPGPITAIREWDGRLVVFQRTAMTMFGAVNDANIVILPEGTTRTGYGCLNAQACDVGPDGEMYFVGENEIYRLSRGSDGPEPLCGDAMRDEIMNKSSASWVESQSFPANAALLTVHPGNREVWVYTQKGNPFVYNIDRQAWTGPMDVAGGTGVSPVGKQISAMKYNPNTGNIYFAFTEASAGTAGIARLDTSQAIAADSISNSGTSAVVSDVWLRPIEPRGGARKILVELVRLYHKITASQTGQTLTSAYSYDHGATFSASNQITVAPVSTGRFRPLTIALRKVRDSIMVRLLHSGNGGSTSFNLSAVEVDVMNMGPEKTHESGTAGTVIS